MTDFSVDFLGCKISHTDAESIKDALAAAGHREADGAAVRVVNTCCITGEAEKKSRKKVRQLLASGDDVRVFVTGCGATLRPELYDELSDRVTALPGSATTAAQRIVEAADQLGGLGCKGADRTSLRTRAFVKIQDGCSFTCSYCIVPTVRGTTRSRTLEGVLTDVRRRVARGQREIVLTGINIGLFREPELRIGLPQLLTEVAEVEGVARVRISSIEVNHVNKRLVAAIAAHPKICPHLHVPMQSGDDRVLGQMRRHYDSSRYLRAIDAARSVLPELNLTTDVIVGYPGEDDAAFASTLRVAQETGITKVHAFPFSARPGTDAETAPDQVPAQVKKARSKQLRHEAHERATQHWQELVGRLDEVLIEARDEPGATLTAVVPDEPGATLAGPAAIPTASPVLRGYTRDYSPVVVTGPARDGDLVAVRVVSATSTHLCGTVEIS